MPPILLAFMKSPRTSLAGVASILAAVSSVVTALTDTDPLTNPDWTMFAAAIVSGIGLITARDHAVSSEQGGVAAQPPKA